MGIGRGPRLAVAYGLLAVAGEFGAHRFYLNRPFTGALMALATLSPAVGALLEVAHPSGSPPPLATVLDNGWVLTIVWMAVDAFLIPRWIDRGLNPFVRARAGSGS